MGNNIEIAEKNVLFSDEFYCIFGFHVVGRLPMLQFFFKTRLFGEKRKKSRKELYIIF